MRTQEGETFEVGFVKLTAENISEYITRDHFRSRTLDAMNPTYIPYEAYFNKPFELIRRLEEKEKKSL